MAGETRTGKTLTAEELDELSRRERESVADDAKALHATLEAIFEKARTKLFPPEDTAWDTSQPSQRAFIAEGREVINVAEPTDIRLRSVIVTAEFVEGERVFVIDDPVHRLELYRLSPTFGSKDARERAFFPLGPGETPGPLYRESLTSRDMRTLKSLVKGLAKNGEAIMYAFIPEKSTEATTPAVAR
jgi:hypothetical protein